MNVRSAAIVTCAALLLSPSMEGGETGMAGVRTTETAAAGSSLPSLAPPYRRPPPIDPDFVGFARHSGLSFLGRFRPERAYRSVLLGRLYFSGEYLAWDMKAEHVPPLLSTAPPSVPPADAGVIGLPETGILVGDHLVHDDLRSGGRVTLGYWCTPFQTSGLEGSYFGVHGGDTLVSYNSTDQPVIARPYVQVPGGVEQSLLVAYPGLLEGQTDIRFDLELAGAEMMLRRAWLWVPGFRLDVLSGYRFGFLSNQLRIQDTSLSLDDASGFPQDALVERTDYFSVSNELHGGQFGFSARRWWGCFSCNLVAKLAVGRAWTDTTINGQTSVSQLVAGELVVDDYAGGLLALPSNSGDFEDNQWGALSEIGVAVEYEFCRNVRAAVGYTFIYWNSVARVADQIDRGIDSAQIPPGNLPGADRPHFQLDRTDFWAQGLNVRVEYQF